MTQQEALAILKTGVNVFLTGEPGAGKSYTVSAYVNYLRSRGVEPSVTASTGIAATHIGGLTIHSWSGIGIKKSLSKYELKEIAERDHVRRRIKAAKVLIIDEISMLDGKTLSLVDMVCQEIRDVRLAFGGLQVIFVGDFFQLPPVTREGEPPIEFAYASETWKQTDPTICYLSEQHRQDDTAFLDVLSAMRRGTVDDDHKELLVSRYTSRTLPDITKLFPHNADVDRLNAIELNKVPGKPVTFSMHRHGAKPLIEALERGCLSPAELVLKIGARVMFTKNNHEENIANGTTGTVVAFDADSGYPVVELASGRTVDTEPTTWAVTDGGRELAAIAQIPLRLAWAMTVHKSQGMSLDNAYVDLSRAFAYGQGYVALSRVRTLNGLYLGGINDRALEVDSGVLYEDALFRKASDTAVTNLHTRTAEEQQACEEAFLRSVGGRLTAQPVEQSAPVAKPKREDRYKATLDLLVTGKGINDVATERSRAPGTILDHLEKLWDYEPLPVAKLRHLYHGPDAALTEMHEAFSLVGIEFLKPAFETLQGKYSYEDLRVARILFPRE